MRSVVRLALFVVCAVLLLTASPGVGANNGECQTCYTYADPSTGIAWAYCDAPADGGWGSSSCTVTCVKYDSGMGACGCTTSGGGCMYIVVQG